MNEIKTIDPAAKKETQPSSKQENKLLVKFKHTYQYEEKEYTELDLSGLEDVTALTMENVGRILAKTSPELNPATVEMTMEYAKLMASRVTAMPLEFFDQLKAQDIMAVKTKIVGFLFGGVGED